MKATLWKELRENLPWALLALLLLGLAEAYALSSGRNTPLNTYDNFTLGSSVFLLVTSFGCALIGVGLAIAQILPEHRTDQWASVLHRPVPRRELFLGKVIPGLLLYLLATLPPLLASIAYAATPGQFAAPFVPGLALPAASDLFLGFTFYALTLLVCLQSGRWLGLRGVIALGGVALFVHHLTSTHPFLVPLLATALLLIAAAGALHDAHRPDRRPTVARIALFVIVLLGSHTIFLVLSVALDWVPWGKPIPTPQFARFLIAPTGEVYVVRKSPDDSGIIVTDTEGNPTPEVSSDLRGQLQFTPISWDLTRSLDWVESIIRDRPRSVMRSVRLVGSGNQGPEQWILLPGRNYFVGYDRLSRRLVSICDSQGFKPADATPVPFADLPAPSNYPFYSPLYYWIDSEVFYFDPQERALTPVADVGSAEIRGIAEVRTDQETPSFAAIGLDDTIRFATATGKPLFTVPYARDINTWRHVSVSATDDRSRYFVLYETAFFWLLAGDDNEARKPTFLDELSPTGQLLATYRLDNPPAPPVRRDWSDYATAATAPLLPTAAFALRARLTPDDHVSTAAPSFFPGLPRNLSPTQFSALTLLGLLLAAATFLWAKQKRFTSLRAATWAAFVIAFGPAGLLTFRLLARWPTDHPCPTCHRPRPVDSNLCPRCGAPWPPPAHAATEILDFPALPLPRA